MFGRDFLFVWCVLEFSIFFHFLFQSDLTGGSRNEKKNKKENIKQNLLSNRLVQLLCASLDCLDTYKQIQTFFSVIIRIRIFRLSPF